MTIADFLFRALRIVLIDVTLAGDNAVVIAMAVASLPPPQRRTGILAGAGFAIALRIFLTFFAWRLLELPFFKLVGGLLILWIAIQLLTESGDGPSKEPAAQGLRQAIWMILVADVTMSLDNIVAVAAASNGSLPLLVAGLALSISFVMFMSGLLARIMARYPIVVWAGAAILGEVAGDMIAGDAWVFAWLKRLPLPTDTLVLASQVGLAVLVLLSGWIIKTKRRKKTASADVS